MPHLATRQQIKPAMTFFHSAAQEPNLFEEEFTYHQMPIEEHQNKSPMLFSMWEEVQRLKRLKRLKMLKRKLNGSRSLGV